MIANTVNVSFGLAMVGNLSYTVISYYIIKDLNKENYANLYVQAWQISELFKNKRMKLKNLNSVSISKQYFHDFFFLIFG